VIKVELGPEPSSMRVRVHDAGVTRLSIRPVPPNGFKSLWRRGLPTIHQLQHQRCAYAALALSRGDWSIEHIEPKSVSRNHGRPIMAYTWGNMVVAAERINGVRGDDQDILDPTSIEDDWFELIGDHRELLVLTTPAIPHHLKGSASNTALRLLNANGLPSARAAYLRAFLRGDRTDAELSRDAPMVASFARARALLCGSDPSLARIDREVTRWARTPPRATS